MSIREIKTHRSHKHRQLQIILTVVSITDNKNLDGKQVHVDVLRIDFIIAPPFHWNAKNQKIC